MKEENDNGQPAASQDDWKLGQACDRNDPDCEVCQ